MNRFIDLATPGVRELRPYTPGKPVEELERELGIADSIKLASNENPLGPSPAALTAMADLAPKLALYPDATGFDLRRTLARRHQIAPDAITLGNGSNDVLVLLAQAFLGPGSRAVYSQYCFAVYPIAVQSVSAKGVSVPALPATADMHLGHDLAAMADAIDQDTRVVFVANPNNPTGTWVEPARLRDWIAGLPEQVIVVVDEAYHEYTGWEQTAADWLGEFPNLVVTRTFSKAYGLAGLRVGYALSDPAVADLLNRVRQPFNVNMLALAAADAAVGDEAFIQRSREVNRSGMQQLRQGLQALDVDLVPSLGNFVLADFAQPAMPIYDALLREGLIVRPVGGYGLPHHLRITIGTETQNQRLLSALKKILGHPG